MLRGDERRLNKIRFITPCSFKSNNQYQNMPSIRWITQSLMHKFDAYAKITKTYDAQALEHIENTQT